MSKWQFVVDRNCGKDKIMNLYKLQGEVRPNQIRETTKHINVAVTRSGDLLYTDYKNIIYKPSEWYTETDTAHTTGMATFQST